MDQVVQIGETMQKVLHAATRMPMKLLPIVTTTALVEEKEKEIQHLKDLLKAPNVALEMAVKDAARLMAANVELYAEIKAIKEKLAEEKNEAGRFKSYHQATKMGWMEKANLAQQLLASKDVEITQLKAEIKEARNEVKRLREDLDEAFGSREAGRKRARETVSELENQVKRLRDIMNQEAVSDHSELNYQDEHVCKLIGQLKDAADPVVENN